MTALIAAQLHERRRSLLSWGLPLGLFSAFIVAIFPSVEASLAQAVRSYPAALKEAFGVGDLSTVEQYLHAEMLSLIVPLAVGYLAVRSVASGLSGAAESGRLDVLLSAPVSRHRLVTADFCATAIELAAVLAVALLLTLVGSLVSGAGLSVRLRAGRLRQRLAVGPLVRSAGDRSHWLLAAHNSRHGVGGGRAGRDVRR